MNSLGNFIYESNRIEGINGILAGDFEAHEEFLASPGGVEDLVTFVARVAQAALRTEFGQNVCVGTHIAPLGGSAIRPLLEEVLREQDPYLQHCHYLTLHPFMDGNGRSARALWLKRMGKVPNIGFLHTFYYQTLEHADER